MFLQASACHQQAVFHMISTRAASRLLRAWLWLAAFMFTAVNGKAQGIAVTPSRMFFNGMPGQAAVQQLELYNTGKGRLVFNASVKDWLRDSTGNKVYYDAGKLPASNATWLEVVPTTIDLGPGEKKTVTVTLHVPATPAAGKNVTNSMLFFTQVNEQQAFTSQKESKIGINLHLELGVHIYHTPPGFSRKDLEFEAFNDQGLAIQQQDTLRQLALKVKNTGDIVADSRIRFEITNKTTGEELQIPVTAVSMLPGAEQVIYLFLPAHLQGRYLAVALLDSGTDTSLKIAEKEVVYDH
jgi:hypothetical protein